MPTSGTAPVVVGVNGTAAGLAAVRVGARESVLREAPLRLVHAFSLYGHDAAGLPYDVLRRRADEVLSRAVAAAVRSAPGARVAGQLVDGLPSRVLLQQSRTAALLVLGNEGSGGTARLPVSSVLVQCLARSRCPTLVVRGAGPPSGPVLVGVDGSATALQAVRWAAAEAHRRHARLEVVHVVGAPDGPGSDRRGPGGAGPGGAGPDGAGWAVLEAALAVTPDPAAVHARLLTGEPGPTLVRAARRSRMLVLGPRGCGSRIGAQLGSVAWAVLLDGSRPTVLVHGTTGGIRAATVRDAQSAGRRADEGGVATVG